MRLGVKFLNQVLELGVSNLNPRVFVVAGGRGTRSENPQLPKILQNVHGNQTLLDLYFEFFDRQDLKDVVFLLGAMSDSILPLLNEKKLRFPNFKIHYFIEESQEGNLPALVKGLEIYPCDEAIVILGDVVVNFTLKPCLDYWRLKDVNLGAIVHPNLHPTDSDRFVMDGSTGNSTFVGKLEELTEEKSGLTYALAGVFFIKGNEIAALVDSLLAKELRDIGSGLVPYLGNNSVPIKSVGYFQDTGTRERLERARIHIESGAYERRGKSEIPCIFIDRDGTIFPDSSRGRIKVSEEEISHDFSSAVKRLNGLGVPMFVVTNQPAVAKGLIFEQDVDRVHQMLQGILVSRGSFIDDFVFCPHHPEKGFPGERIELKCFCNCRKPNTGLIEQLRNLYGLSIKNSIMIGDSIVDEQLATNLGMRFIKAPGLQSNFMDCSKQLETAIGLLVT